MRSSRVILPSLLSIAFLAAVLMAIGRHDGRITVGHRGFDRVEIQLNTFTGSAQSEVALDMARDGAVVAAWDSRRQDRGTYGVFARWVDPLGRPTGPEEQVNVEQRSMQMMPAVSLNEDDEALFAWQSLLQDGDAGAIIGRTTGDERIVNATTAGDQSRVAIDRLADGRSVAAWQTAAGQPPEPRVALRLLDASGNPCGEELVIDAPPGTRDQLPCVAADGRGGFVLAWARTASGGTVSAIRAMRFDGNLAPVGAALAVSESDRGAIEPSIAADRSGGFAVAWLEYDPKTEYDVMMRRYRADGEALGEPALVSVDPEGWQSGVALSMDSRGRSLVAWNTSRDGGLDSDIYARLFDEAGDPESGDFLVNGRTEGMQALAAGTGVRRAALGDDGRMAFAWQGNSGNGDESAANLTVLIPARTGLAGDLASGLRRARDLFASRSPEGVTRLDRTATPYIPPTYDPTQRGSLLDPESRVVGDRQVGFTAFTNTGWTPPDPHMAAGPTHLMAIVNGGIAVFTKDGTRIWQDDISNTGGFWGEVGATSFVFDPEVIYDPYSQRFMAMANERSNDNRSMFLLGISHTSDPSNQAAWYKYRFDVTALAGNDTDSPNIAIDRDAIYITADFFTGGQKYLIYIIDKASVIDGGAAVTTSYLHQGSQSFGIPVMYTDEAPRMYMIEHFEADPSSTIRLWAINDPLGNPSLTSFTLSVPQYYRPANLVSQGTSVQVITFDSRFWSCMYRDGSLWAAHHISLSNSPRLCVSRWYEIEMNGWPVSGSDPTLKQAGTVAPPDNVFCSFNSIGADAAGNAVMVFTRSSANEYFSIARTYRFPGDPLGTMSPPEFVKQSNFAYNQDRWGDYSAVVPDPANLGDFWMHHEYTPGTNSWHTWIAGEMISPAGSYLTLGGSEISDDDLGQSNGNGDGGINPTETIEVWVTLRNVGQATSTNVSGVLSVEGGQATIVDGDATWNDIPPGGQGQSLTPFVFQVSSDVADGSTLPFLLTTTDDMGVREIDLPLAVLAPVLVYDSHVIDDATHGNGNGIPEPGEVLVLSVQLLNTGGQSAEGVSAILSCDNPDVVVIDEQGGAGEIASGGSGVLDPPYRIAILPSALDGELLPFDLAITAASGYATNASFTQRVGSLFFDDVEADAGWSLASQGDNATGGQWVRVDPNGTVQNGQPCQPEDDHTPAPGTMCFVTGQGPVGGVSGLADVDAGTTTLTTPAFDLTRITEPVLSYWCWYTNNLGSNPNQDTWLVQISSDGGETWVDLENTTASHNAWEQRSFVVSDYITLTNRVVVRFVASDLGLASLVEAAVDDFLITGEPGVVEASDAEVLTAVRLDPALPNPMQDHATLSFALPQRGAATLRIYHADGRLVRTLVDGVVDAGVHRVEWNGRAAGDRRVSSGIYFAKLTAGEEVRTRRLVVLR